MNPVRLPFLTLLLAGCTLNPADWDTWHQERQGDDPPVLDSDQPVDDTGEAEDDTGAEVDDTGPFDTDEPGLPPQPQVLTPGFGPRGGGSVVTLAGVDLDPEAAVSFGGAAASVTGAGVGSLELITPAVASAGVVDVTVTQDGGQAMLPSGFRYLDLDDESGMVAAKGALQWFDHRGSYWAHDVEDYGLVQLWFPARPDNERYRDLFAPGLDSCTSDSFEVDSRGGMDLSGASVTLSGDLGSLEPEWVSDETRFELMLGAQSLEESASYALTIGGLWGLDDFTIDGLAATPEPFMLTSPDIAGSEPPTLEQDQLAFRWQEIEADAVVIYIARVSGDGRETFEILSCLVENDGAFTIPTSAWEGWRSGHQLYTYIGALRESETTVPLNNGSSSVAGISWNVGVILTR